MYRTTGQRVFGNEQMHPLLRAGLVGHWVGGGSGTTWFDRSGYGNHGVLTNGPLWTLGEGGKRNALSFDGTNDFVLLGGSLALTSPPMTFSAWIKPNVANMAMIFSIMHDGGDWNGFYMDSSGGGLQVVTVGNTSFAVALAEQPPIGVWSCVCAVFASSTSRTAYLNGVPGTTDTTSKIPLVAPDRVHIGNGGPSADQFFNGSIDDVRLYNRALSSAEITLLASRN